MRRTRSVIAYVLLLAALAPAAPAAAQREPGQTELRASQALEAIRGDPLALYVFLKRMPKGADLHSHLHSAVYAETLIRNAVEDGLCVDPVVRAFTKPTSVEENGPACGKTAVPAAKAYEDMALYNDLIEAFSMRDFVPSESESGRDHFFGAFSKFAGVDASHTGEWLDEVANRAARQNMQYLELMAVPPWNRLNTVTKEIAYREDLGALRDELLRKGLAEDVAAARVFWDTAETKRNELGKCGQAHEAPGCKVELRYIFEVFRNTPKELVFAQALLGFELALSDPRIVAVSLVGEEDAHGAMTDYAEHMRMVGFLRNVYPRVHVSLHAGELAPGLVPPEGLCCHIRLAVEQARAKRIGHGVDIMHEDEPYDLLRNMADKGVLVEINLTSNDMILGVRGKHHPFLTYRQFGVPVALATDDAGIERIDLTHEFVRAVSTYGLTYADLKELVRNSLEHSFLPGKSLWDGKGGYLRFAPACARDVPDGKEPSPGCAGALAASEKAAQQWELERRFKAFEASF
ncbi:MAG TPA: adenosine deaminase [Methyloceanibacter sp.]|nr:adenosine deaminase [Methyloceanibacter sp.]